MNTKYKSLIIPSLLAIFTGSAFSTYWNSPVKGSVMPTNGAIRAWVISRTDTLNSPVIQGTFTITNVKPGNYMLMIEAKPPFKDSYRQDVLVVDGQPTDVGIIEMKE